MKLLAIGIVILAIVSATSGVMNRKRPKRYEDGAVRDQKAVESKRVTKSSPTDRSKRNFPLVIRPIRNKNPDINIHYYSPKDGDDIIHKTYEETHEHIEEGEETESKSIPSQKTEEIHDMAIPDETKHVHHVKEQHHHTEKIKIKHHHHHHHHNHVKHVIKKIPVEKIVHVPVEKIVHVPKTVMVEKIVEKPVIKEKKVPYEVKVPVPYEKIVHVPVEKVVEKVVHVPKPYPVEKIVHVPVEKIIEKVIHIPVDKIIHKVIHVPKPYPVEKIVEKPVTVEKRIPVEVKVPYPVEKIIEKIIHVPQIVEKVVHVPKPYPVIKPAPYPVEVKVPYPVEVKVPVPVHVPKPVPYAVEKKVAVPVKIEVEKKVPVYIHTKDEHHHHHHADHHHHDAETQEEHHHTHDFEEDYDHHQSGSEHNKQVAAQKPTERPKPTSETYHSQFLNHDMGHFEPQKYQQGAESQLAPVAVLPLPANNFHINVPDESMVAEQSQNFAQLQPVPVQYQLVHIQFPFEQPREFQVVGQPAANEV